MREIIFDIETNGLDNCTKIHCLSYCVVGEYALFTIYDYDEIREFFKQDAIFIGHYISNFDLPTLNRLLGIDFRNVTFYDTLLLANYIIPERENYKLESFGEEYGVLKTKVTQEQWDGDMSDPEYKLLITNRCEGDVKINSNLWVVIYKRLSILYNNNRDDVSKILAYLAFKASRAYMQMTNPCSFDEAGATELLNKLTQLKNEKVDVLRSAMPTKKTYKVKSLPKTMVVKGGGPSAEALKWYKFLNDYGIPEDNTQSVKYVSKEEEPNPNSWVQIKEWLFNDLGWVPANYKYVKDKEKGTVRKVPQIQIEVDGVKELCPSVLLLAEKEPAIEVLSGIGLLTHRIGVITGFIEKSVNNSLSQILAGLTNTLRWRHQSVTNLVGVDKPYGKELRSLFVKPDGKKVVGLDLTNLEVKLLQHYIWDIDNSYVKQLQDPEYDSHLALAVKANFITPQQALNHKSGIENHSVPRKRAKVANFSCQYGVGPETLSRSLGISRSQAQKLINGYKEINWSITELANRTVTKSALGLSWVYNPVSGFWLNLRNDKDKVSTLIQSTAAYTLDTLNKYLIHYGIVINLDVHDEDMFYCVDTEEDIQKTIGLLNKCCTLMNKRLSLNVKLNIDYNIGDSYGDVH